VIVPQFLSETDLQEPRRDLSQLFPPPEQFHGDTDEGRNQRFRGHEFAGLLPFPFPPVSLSLLVVHPKVVSFAEAAFGTDDIRIYNAEAWAKYAGAADYEQDHRRDYLNHTPLVPSEDWRFRGLEMFLWLTDVPESSGPTHLVPRSLTAHLPPLPHGYRREALGDLYENEVSSAGPAGTLVAYSTDTFHRGTAITDPGGARFSLHLSYRRTDNAGPRSGRQDRTTSSTSEGDGKRSGRPRVCEPGCMDSSKYPPPIVSNFRHVDTETQSTLGFPGMRSSPRFAAAPRVLVGPVLLLAALTAITGCGASDASSTNGVVRAIGTENEYANVLSQIGGRYVSVSSILNNPNTDPHTFESSPGIAQEVSAAQLIVQNGVGYDDFMNKIESASANSSRKVIVVQHVLGLPDNTPNPHLWYSPTTMPAVAKVMASDLSQIEPSHASYFSANLQKFDTSLSPWFDAIAEFKARFNGVAVATTEPVADYLLQALGANNLTPFRFQADVMNGEDPSPEDVSLENGFFTRHQVKVFCYNQQVVDALTSSIRHNAEAAGVPVVGVYETMPTPGYDFQTWMLTEVQDIQKAITSGVSTQHL
jgi:zinc/manganese transport system substrate-binding protein